MINGLLPNFMLQQCGRYHYLSPWHALATNGRRSGRPLLLRMARFRVLHKCGILQRRRPSRFLHIFCKPRSALKADLQFWLAAFLNGNETGYLVEVCAGLIGETKETEETAGCEVLEEADYEVGDLIRVGGAYYSAGGITEYLYLFITEYDSGKPSGKAGGLQQEGENTSLVELSFDEAEKRTGKWRIHDAKTIMLLQHFFLHLLADKTIQRLQVLDGGAERIVEVAINRFAFIDPVADVTGIFRQIFIRVAAPVPGFRTMKAKVNMAFSRNDHPSHGLTHVVQNHG
jgi:8-oxo-dGTP pyrophosphatase MutT (NUDIX family)